MKIVKAISGIIFGVFVWTLLNGESRASVSDYFDQKDESFWVLKKGAFKAAADTMLDDKGNWKGNPPVPQYIKYVEKLEEEDLPYLEKWLSLKGLECFSIAGQKEEPNVGLILNWWRDLVEAGVDVEKKNLYKLAWLNSEETTHELTLGESARLPAVWIETNRDFQMKDSHYRYITAH